MSYSAGKIFADSEVNALLDRFMYELVAASGLPSLEDKLCLTGRAAAIMQGASAKECQNIILITADASLYELAWKQLPKRIASRGSVFYKERVLFYFDKVFIEVWFSAEPVTSVSVSGIFLQHISKIPAILL